MSAMTDASRPDDPSNAMRPTSSTDDTDTAHTDDSTCRTDQTHPMDHHKHQPTHHCRFASEQVNPRSGKRVDVSRRPARRCRPLCDVCRQRPALASIRERWVVSKDHDLWRQCSAAAMDSRYALRRWRTK